MIPKVIHYCWFGRNPLPPLALKCIESWKKFFPNYEIKEWNEDNFNVNMIPYTAEAYHAKKYAFVSDYARFWILYNYGGLYFDTDVEIIKPMDDIIANGSFMGCELWEKRKGVEEKPSIAPGLGLGAESGNSLYKEILDIYKTKHLVTYKGVIADTVVTIVTRLLLQKQQHLNLKEITTVKDITIYPYEYFSPIIAGSGEEFFTENTRSIHHYMASWKVNKKTARIKNIQNRLHYIFNQLYVMLFVKIGE